MAKVIAIANQKGGVGKTTTCVNLSSCVAALGKKVLVVDLDPQGNTTSGYGVAKKGQQSNIYTCLINDDDVRQAIVHTKFNADLIASNTQLAGAVVELVELPRRENRLRSILAPLIPLYDYVFIDCPPSLDLLTVNGLCACDTVLIPIQCEYYAIEGLSQLMTTVRQVKRLYNADLELEGVLLTMYDRRLNLTAQVKAEVENFFPGKVFKAIIPRAVRLSEAPSYGKPIQYYDKRSKGARAYESLAKEIIRNDKKQEG